MFENRVLMGTFGPEREVRDAGGSCIMRSFIT
jgi:hypothetical protein